MKLPVAWLREWVDVPWETAELSRRLTASGFEVEGVEGAGDDAVFELKTYANRGDSMSVLGVAREVAALTGGPLKTPAGTAAKAEDTAGDAGNQIAAPIVEAPAATPRFLLRRINGIDNRRATPAWLAERLQRAGSRSISPVVDITNFVLLELGQPMHAYDATHVQGTLRARYARPEESLTLLDGREVKLAPDVLVIADNTQALGMAGVMGGLHTSITPAARDVLLEVAFFSPDAIAGRGRRFGITTDASQRFERGVDPAGQHRAMERATTLILDICGGRASDVRQTVSEATLPQRQSVLLRRARVALLTGANIADARVAASLEGLGISLAPHAEGWIVTPPSWRFDLCIEADFIEEVLRIVGFDAVQEAPRRLPQRFARRSESRIDERAVFDVLTSRGYQEAIHYAFVDPVLQQQLFPGRGAITLANPIASDLAQMRVSLWPGLLKTALTNLARQQDRMRLFEKGAVFAVQQQQVREVPQIAGVFVGTRSPEQWGAAREAGDFFDLKADVTALLQLAGPTVRFEWHSSELTCLHPGRGATVLRDGRPVGWLGELHPQLAVSLGFTTACLLFEIDLEAALHAPLPVVSTQSRFPQVRRDLAVTVPVATPLSTLVTHASVAAGELLTDLRVFDIYQGAGIEPTRKSVALGLIFQDKSKTLTDAEADSLMAAVAAELGATLDAKVRS